MAIGKRKGLNFYAFADDYCGHKRVLVPVRSAEEAKNRMIIHYTTRELTPDELNRNVLYPNDVSWVNYRIARDDADLIAVVEEMGEKADGDYAELRIVEIPDDVQWEIHDNDGSEHVAEKHRTWY